METLLKLATSWNTYTLLFWIGIVFLVLAVVNNVKIAGGEATTGRPGWAMALGIVFLLASASFFAYENNSRFRSWASIVLGLERPPNQSTPSGPPRPVISASPSDEISGAAQGSASAEQAIRTYYSEVQKP